MRNDVYEQPELKILRKYLFYFPRRIKFSIIHLYIYYYILLYIIYSSGVRLVFELVLFVVYSNRKITIISVTAIISSLGGSGGWVFETFFKVLRITRIRSYLISVRTTKARNVIGLKITCSYILWSTPVLSVCI